MSLTRARQAFEDIVFHPQVLRDVSHVDTGVDVLGGRLGASVRHRTDRVHPPDAHRGRACRRGRRRRGRDPLLALDARHRVGRGGRGGEPRRPELVPALHVEGPRPVARARAAGCRRGVRHAARDGRRPGRRRAAARPSKRDDDPTEAQAHDGARRGSPAGLVVRLRHDRTARLRVVRPVGGDRGRAARHDVRPDAHRRGPRVDQGSVGGQAGRQRRPDTRRRTANRVARRRRRSRCRITVAGSSTARRSRSICCPTSPARSGRTSRSISTPGS